MITFIEHNKNLILAVYAAIGVEALHVVDIELTVKIVCQLAITGATIYNLLKRLPDKKD